MRSIIFILLIVGVSWTQAAKVVDVTHHVIFEVSQGGQRLGTITIGLFGNEVPETVRNFATLASQQGFNGRSYRGSIFHRVIPRFMLQGGDIMNGDGTGSISIYGGKFRDENFNIKHTEPGLLSMANSGPDTNGSQFFITVATTSWLDGKHVVFGKVIDGYNVVEAIERTPTRSDRPINEVRIESTRVEPVQGATYTLHRQ